MSTAIGKCCTAYSYFVIEETFRWQTVKMNFIRNLIGAIAAQIFTGLAQLNQKLTFHTSSSNEAGNLPVDTAFNVSTSSWSLTCKFVSINTNGWLWSWLLYQRRSRMTCSDSRWSESGPTANKTSHIRIQNEFREWDAITSSTWQMGAFPAPSSNIRSAPSKWNNLFCWMTKIICHGVLAKLTLVTASCMPLDPQHAEGQMIGDAQQ